MTLGWLAVLLWTVNIVWWIGRIPARGPVGPRLVRRWTNGDGDVMEEWKL